MQDSHLQIENQIQYLTNFQELVSTPFQGNINALCWKRELVGDFSEIVKHVELDENIVVLDPADLQRLKLTDQGQLAREFLLNDLKLLEDHGASPTLNVIKYYDRDVSNSLFPTDVYSYHVDRSPIPTSTFLCTYYGESSDILPNSQATQKVLIPEIRNELKKLYGYGTEVGFEIFLNEHFFNLHYQAKSNAQPINLGIGHLWRLACDHPESKVLPCIHRAPKEENEQARLLMIC
ncbi:MAG: hypothetical protein ACI9IP_000694 [Arcticibacterium sp.]|jgi:hypothetical protein